MLEAALLAIVLIAVLALVLRIANPLPTRRTLPADPPLAATESRLHLQATRFTAGHDGQSALRLLSSGIDAFAMRLAMVHKAERALDAQYYIWEDDLSGRMLLAAIMEAADRGVRVRLLIDDNPTAGLDPMWAGVNAHPNIAVRLFNPLTIRRFRPANYLFDFPRLNRRMHNKSFTVDGAATIVGGRNIGDAYFGARDSGLFIDVDAFAVGPVVNDAADEFERYWSSASAYPAEWMLNSRGALPLSELRDPPYRDAGKAQEYRDAAQNVLETLMFAQPDQAFVWAPVRLVADDPAKALGRARRESLMAAKIAPLLKDAREQVDLVSGYFVPGDPGTELLAGMARRGIKLRIATNSIQVTDVPLVHAGYIPYRPALLAAGAQLFEARPLDGDSERVRRLSQTRFSGGGESVHAKTFQVDGRRLFVGSFNFDPRSALLNCEMGLVIDAPPLALALKDVLDRQLQAAAYRVEIGQRQHLVWKEKRDEDEVEWHEEPGTSAIGRALVSFLSILPIKWML